METKTFLRSATDKKLGGVCAGIANYFGWDPLLIRIAFIVLFCGYGVGGLAYILLWILAPEEGGK